VWKTRGAPEPAVRRWKLEGVAGPGASRPLREGDLVLVDVAEGDDAREDRRVRFGHVEEEVAREPACASRWQIERGVRECVRVMRGGKARHERSVEERAHERRHERRRGGEGEHTSGGRGGHPRILRTDSRRLNFSVSAALSG